MNGEYLNATCGRDGRGSVFNGTRWNGHMFRRAHGEKFVAGIGCSSDYINGTECIDGEYLLGGGSISDFGLKCLFSTSIALFNRVLYRPPQESRFY